MSMRVWILGIFVLIAVMMYMPQVNAQNNNLSKRAKQG